MGLYFSGSVGYGFSVRYTPEVFEILKEYYEQRTGKNWEWEEEGADMDFLGGYDLFPGVYVHSIYFEEISENCLYVVASETKIDLEKGTLAPTPIDELEDVEVISILSDLAALYEVELATIVYTVLG